MVVADEVDGLAAVGRLVDIVALSLERHRDDAQDIGVVISDDDRLGHGSPVLTDLAGGQVVGRLV